jgi:AcrR family transcriptional regulator
MARLSVVRTRTRPTREDTRERVFRAAVTVFAAKGIGDTSIAEVTEAAGLTRGAFYSNFASKDELVVAMLEDHVEDAIARNHRLAEKYRDPLEFLTAIAAGEDKGHYLWDYPALQFDLLIYATRSADLRPKVSAMLQSLRTMIGQIVVDTMRSAGLTVPIDVQQAGSILLALEDGFRLHRMIDPDVTPADAYITSTLALAALVLDRQGNPTPPPRGARQSRRSKDSL